jgi:hypothetical protein
MWQLIAAGASLLGGISEGQQAARNLARQAAIDEFEARGALEQAREEAQNIYANAAAIKAEQVAQFAAAGVVIGDGSAQAVIDETDRLSRQDALASLYTGGRQAAALRASASARRAQEDDAVLSGLMKGIAGAAGNIGSYASTRGSSAKQ